MWHLTACKISVSPLGFELDQKWNDFFFYRISELMLVTLIQSTIKIISVLATLIQRNDEKSFHFADVWLHPLFWGPCLLVWIFLIVIRLCIYEFGIRLGYHDHYYTLWSSSRTREQLKLYRLSGATFYECINTIKPFLNNNISERYRDFKYLPLQSQAAMV